MTLTAFKPLFYPWLGVLAPRFGSDIRPYFGPPTLASGGPSLKRKKLSHAFGNAWWSPTIIYVTSGLPMGPAFLLWAKRAGARIVLNQDGVFTRSWYSGDVERANRLLRKLHELSDFVIYQSRFCQAMSERYLGPTTARRHKIVFNGVDLTRFAPAENGPRKPGLRLLCGGYFYRSKLYILQSVLSALSILRKGDLSVELVIAGKVDASVSELLRQHGVSPNVVTFLGPYSQAQAPTVFRRADLFLHLKNNDPCPSIVIEAMASGLPVVHCGNGGTPELVGDAGVSIRHEADPESADAAPPPEAIAAAIRDAASRLDELRGRARERSRQFSLDGWIEEHRTIFNSLASKSL